MTDASAPVTIRAATLADTARIVAILHDEPGQEILALAGGVRAAQRVGALIVRNSIQTMLPRTSVAEVDGVIAGFVESYTVTDEGAPPLALVLKTLAQALPIAGPAGLLRFLRWQQARGRIEMRPPRGAYLVNEVDVHPAFRNRGIGGKLLDHAEADARRRGHGSMSLSTSTTNPAQHLYTRHGYRIVETRLDAGYEKITGIPGRVLMVKDLNAPS